MCFDKTYKSTASQVHINTAVNPSTDKNRKFRYASVCQSFMSSRLVDQLMVEGLSHTLSSWSRPTRHISSLSCAVPSLGEDTSSAVLDLSVKMIPLS